MCIAPRRDVPASDLHQNGAGDAGPDRWPGYVVSETEVVLDPGDEIEDAGEAAAVPAGGGSSAPSLPVWAFVLIIAGTLGMAVSGKRLAGSLLR
jgi:hypothetical protein